MAIDDVKTLEAVVATSTDAARLRTAGLLSVISLIACYLPAHRVARLDPVVAMREV